MLGRQTNLLKSPLAGMNQQATSLLNFNSSINTSSLANSNATLAATTGPTLNVPTSGNSIDEKSIKDIIQIINKCIDKTKNLTEFSQILQVDNIGLFKN